MTTRIKPTGAHVRAKNYSRIVEGKELYVMKKGADGEPDQEQKCPRGFPV